MCDYSLMHYNSRLAEERETLFTHRFSSHSVGMVSEKDFKSGSPCDENSEFCAVCIPPGTRIRLRGIPEDIQQRRGVSREETVVFDQLNFKTNSHRDAIRFSNGQAVLLQDLDVGVEAFVISMAESEELKPVMENGELIPLPRMVHAGAGL